MTETAGRRLGVRLTGALGYLSMAGSLSTDLYLPAFPDIADDLGAPASVVQLTLTAFLIGSALGQLAIGSVSDVFGRRRTLIVALAVFTACCFLAVASPVIGMLIVVRGVQGFAGAAGLRWKRLPSAWSLTSRSSWAKAWVTAMVEEASIRAASRARGLVTVIENVLGMVAGR